MQRSRASRHRTSSLPISILAAGLVFAATVAQGDWAQFRGPDRDGQAPMFEAPKAWPEAPEQIWRVKVGEGQASPVIAGDRIYLLARQGDDEIAMALDAASGKVLWRHGFPTDISQLNSPNILRGLFHLTSPLEFIEPRLTALKTGR
ncbi:MAG: PQQ-binding-like beta-propeller repeat protein [Bacteroidota bacterium]